MLWLKDINHKYYLWSKYYLYIAKTFTLGMSTRDIKIYNINMSKLSIWIKLVLIYAYNNQYKWFAKESLACINNYFDFSTNKLGKVLFLPEHPTRKYTNISQLDTSLKWLMSALTNDEGYKSNDTVDTYMVVLNEHSNTAL